jgi:hypothetical protein
MMSGFDWASAMIGFGAGLIVSSVIWVRIMSSQWRAVRELRESWEARLTAAGS